MKKFRIDLTESTTYHQSGAGGQHVGNIQINIEIIKTNKRHCWYPLKNEIASDRLLRQNT